MYHVWKYLIYFTKVSCATEPEQLENKAAACLTKYSESVTIHDSVIRCQTILQACRIPMLTSWKKIHRWETSLTPIWYPIVVLAYYLPRQDMWRRLRIDVEVVFLSSLLEITWVRLKKYGLPDLLAFPESHVTLKCTASNSLFPIRVTPL